MDFEFDLMLALLTFVEKQKKELLLDAKQGNEIINYNLLGSF